MSELYNRLDSVSGFYDWACGINEHLEQLRGIYKDMTNIAYQAQLASASVYKPSEEIIAAINASMGQQEQLASAFGCKPYDDVGACISSHLKQQGQLASTLCCMSHSNVGDLIGSSMGLQGQFASASDCNPYDGIDTFISSYLKQQEWVASAFGDNLFDGIGAHIASLVGQQEWVSSAASLALHGNIGDSVSSYLEQQKRLPSVSICAPYDGIGASINASIDSQMHITPALNCKLAGKIETLFETFPEHQCQLGPTINYNIHSNLLEGTRQYPRDGFIDSAISEDNSMRGTPNHAPGQTKNTPRAIQEMDQIQLTTINEEEIEFNLEDNYHYNEVLADVYHIQSMLLLCNQQTKISGRTQIFEYTDKFLESLISLNRNNPGSKNSFANLVDALYIIFYEGAGSDKLRFLRSYDGVLDGEEDCEFIWGVKHLRNKMLRHDIEHGEEKNIKRSHEVLGKTLQWVGIGRLPKDTQDYQYMHHRLIREAKLFIDQIYNCLTKLYSPIFS